MGTLSVHTRTVGLKNFSYYLLGSGGGSSGGTGRGTSGGGSTIPCDFREGDLDAEFTVVYILLVDGSKGLLLVFRVVELDKTESLAAVVVLADNVGSLNVQALEDLSQTCVIYAEGEIGHEKSVARWGFGTSLGVSLGGTRGSLAALALSSTGLVLALGTLVLALSLVLALRSTTLNRGTVSGAPASEAASTTEATTAAATASTSPLGSVSTSSGGTILGRSGSIGVLGGLLLAGASNLYVDLTAVDELLVEEFHRLLGLLLRLHFDKPVSKGTGSAGNDARGSNFSCCLKFFGEVSVIGLEGQISNEYLGPPHDFRFTVAR